MQRPTFAFLGAAFSELRAVISAAIEPLELRFLSFYSFTFLLFDAKVGLFISRGHYGCAGMQCQLCHAAPASRRGHAHYQRGSHGVTGNNEKYAKKV